jgi:hypothetical protein
MDRETHPLLGNRRLKRGVQRFPQRYPFRRFDPALRSGFVEIPDEELIEIASELRDLLRKEAKLD